MVVAEGRTQMAHKGPSCTVVRLQSRFKREKKGNNNNDSDFITKTKNRRQCDFVVSIYKLLLFLHLWSPPPQKKIERSPCHVITYGDNNTHPEATPKSAHAALLLVCPIFTCVQLYMTLAHGVYSKVNHTLRAARSGQLSPEVSYTDWTYADSFRFIFYFLFF